jgi:DNA polymerase-3 subunit alpha
MKYVSLHHHSTYSFLDGYGHPKEHVARAAELGMSALALTEHGNISSHPKLEQAAREAGIKPIFGCELYTGSQPSQRKNHLSAWAMDRNGYQNLIRMVTWAWQEGFYYEPTVDGECFRSFQEGLIVGSGCTGGLLATSLIGGKNIPKSEASYNRGKRVAERFRSLLGDRYYLEVQAFPELESTRAINAHLEELAKSLNIQLVATGDVHYCRREDYDMQVILHATRPGSNRTFEQEANSWGYDVPMCHPESDAYVLERLLGTGLSKKAALQAIANTAEIAERCTVELPKAAPLKYPGSDSASVLVRRWLKAGWDFRRIDDKPNADEYAERLKYELGLIEEKDFVDYFLFVSDLVRWSKDNGIAVGPARGSAAASLVCYLLRITEVDPLIFPDLVFERFIDVTRIDLPDIDLDFDDGRRHEVFEYLARKYGADHVGQLGTFTTYKAKLALDDVARVYRIPKWDVDKVKELLIVRSSGDLRASATIEDTVAMFPPAAEIVKEHPKLLQSTRLEGMVKGMGKHAAGAIVASGPLTDVCAVYGDKLAVDKYDAEYLNLLKMDLLGLSTMGMLSEAVGMLGMTINDLYSVPLDDKETLRGFRENDVVGVFQFDGRAMRTVNGNLVPDSFYEVCVVNALARPGPLHNRATTFYVDTKLGVMEPDRYHPLFDRIVANTQYQVVYQEQILRIVREIGNFDWTAHARIRKIISRKIGDQAFNREKARFLKGAKENGVPQDTAEKIWGMCITAGSYAFNAAHSVSYGMIAWWCMWLKRHHPLIFYIAALKHLPKIKQQEVLRDAVKHGIKVLAPDPARSGVTWKSEGKHTIIAGFSQIPGIGLKMGEAIVQWRGDRDHVEWEDIIGVNGIGPKTIMNILSWVGQEDPLGVHVLDKQLKRIVSEIQVGKHKTYDGSRVPVPTHTAADIPTLRGPDIQLVWIGVCTARNLRDLFEVNFSRTGVPLDPASVKRPDLREWVLLYGYDGFDTVTLRIDRYRYPRFKNAVWNIKLGKDLVLVRGVKRGDLPQKMVYVSDMWVFE